MESILVEVAKQSPVAVAIVIVVLIMQRILSEQKAECHEFQKGIASDYRDVTSQARETMDKTNECLTRCAVAHERSEKVWRKYLTRFNKDEDDNTEMPKG